MAQTRDQAISIPLKDDQWRIRLARVAWLFVFALLTVIFIASVDSATAYERRSWQFTEALPAVSSTITMFDLAAVIVAARAVVVALFYAVALLIAWRKWNDWFALFVSAALLLVIYGFGARSDTATYVFPAVLRPLEPALTFFLQTAFLLSWVLLFYLLPDGRFVPRRAGWFVLLLLPGTILLTLGNTFASTIPSAYRERLAELSWGLFFISFLIAIMAGLFTQLHRYRNVATPAQRQQMKWILLGLAAQPLPLFLGIAGLGGAWGAVAAIFIPLFVVALLPIAIGLAVFRRRLWDVDPLINRSLVYGGLTLLVLALYVGLVALAFVLFGATSNLFLAALAVGVAALLAQPLRAGLQRAVNRLMYGDRDDPATVLARLGDRLATAAAPTETLPLLVEGITQALRLPYAAVEMAGDGHPHLVAQSGQRPANTVRLPLAYQSAPMGYLLVAPRSPEESFTPAERRLLDSIAQQAGAAVYAAQLTHHLQRSREQLVLAREEERRRLQRDLHDGLGPQLAALGMQLDVARGLAADSPAVTALLVRLAAETQTAIADIRRLVYDLRPPALDQLGLVGALREYVAGQPQTGGPRWVIDAPASLPPLPAAVEVAAYRIAQEATANCLRHAAAETCRIVLRIDDGLRLDVIDDGRGLPAAVVSGVGLASMRERAAELGGAWRIESLPGGGTRVTATLPLPQGRPS